MIMIHSSGLRFQYNATTVFNFPGLHCAAGQTCVVTGNSGKGKTTLLHLLGGLLKPSAGSISIAQTEVTTLSGRQLDAFRGKHIGIVFQESHFVQSLNVLDNLLLPARFTGTKGQKEKALSLLEQLGIADQVHKPTGSLSQGQQQRLSIARALINDPALVLADEPTSGLDDENCHKVAALLMQQARVANAALIIVTHDQRLKNEFHHLIHLS